VQVNSNEVYINIFAKEVHKKMVLSVPFRGGIAARLLLMGDTRSAKRSVQGGLLRDLECTGIKVHGKIYRNAFLFSRTCQKHNRCWISK